MILWKVIFLSRVYTFNIPAGPSDISDNISFPYPVRIYSAHISTSEGENDIIKAFLEYLSGLTTFPIDQGNVLKVNNTNQITLGDKIIVEDGSNIHDLGVCIHKDGTEIVISKNIQSLINRNSILKVRKYIINSTLPSDRIINGNGFFLPSNLAIKINYHNNKTLSIIMEMIY